MKKTYLVVGGSGGIGREVVNLLLSEGHRVLATHFSSPPGNSEVEWLKVDLSNLTEVKEASKKLIEALDGIDGVIFCQGIYDVGPILAKSIDRIEEVMNINLLSSLVILKTLFPLLEKSHGRVIFFSSDSGIVPYKHEGLYVTSKFALSGSVQVLEKELKDRGIYTTTLVIGISSTSIAQRAYNYLESKVDTNWSQEIQDLLRGKDEVYSVISQGISPDKIASVVSQILKLNHPKSTYFLLSDDEVEFIDMELQQLRINLRKNRI